MDKNELSTELPVTNSNNFNFPYLLLHIIHIHKNINQKDKIEIVENLKVCEEFEFTKVFQDLSK